MKRWALRICVLLLLGAIVNVAVAFGFWLWGERPISGTFDSIDHWHNGSSTTADSLIWDAMARPDWPRAPYRTLYQSMFGMRHTMMIDSKNDFDISEVSDEEAMELRKKRVFYSVTSTSCGWPFSTAVCSRADVTAGFPPTFTSWEDSWSMGRLMIPRRIIWPGFAINTVFYAAALWGLFAVPSALGGLRKRRRIKRGWCPKCAYNLRGRAPDSTVCPECGAAVRF